MSNPPSPQKQTTFFLSAVTKEFGSYRTALADAIKGPGIEVKVQEDFINSGQDTLKKLDDYIKRCDVVIHLVGDATGTKPTPANVQALLNRYQNFAVKVPALAPLLQGGAVPDLSFTQWEAYLAFYHNCRCCIYRAADGVVRDIGYVLDSTAKTKQEVHFQRFRDSDRDRAPFDNQNNLVISVLRDLHGIATCGPDVKPLDFDAAERAYLHHLANKQEFCFADFQGIFQFQTAVALRLDDIFVDLTAARRESTGSYWSPMQNVLEERGSARITLLEEAWRRGVFSPFDPNNPAVPDSDSAEKKFRPAEPQDIGRMLAENTAVVLLGGPGSGKTTLVKRLVRAHALGADTVAQWFPPMTAAFPIVAPITAYANACRKHGGNHLPPLLDWLKSQLHELGQQFQSPCGDALLLAFERRWEVGQVFLILDGLDEVASLEDRYLMAKAATELVSKAARNRLLLTSRIVGYEQAPITAPIARFDLQAFSAESIRQFLYKWHEALAHREFGDQADLAAAHERANSLDEQLQRNPRVASLATNPLMLTIMALIQRANVVLPERRAQLYDRALHTLIESWNLARSNWAGLNKQPALQVDPDVSFEIWGAIALWMHENVNRVVHRDKLREQLVSVFMNRFGKSRTEAMQEARSYLDTAAQRHGLLEERGQDWFAFVHQTFQEYLAARELCQEADKAKDLLWPRRHDPRWQEVFRLAVGHLVNKGERRKAEGVIYELLHDQDPLEPFLYNSLRLAVSCLADGLNLNSSLSDLGFSGLAEALAKEEEGTLRQAFRPDLRRVPGAPGTKAQAQLLVLVSHEDWWIRQEALCVLGRVETPDDRILTAFRKCFKNDGSGNARAHAAWGLWRWGQDRNDAVARAIFSESENELTDLKVPPDSSLIQSALTQLHHADADFRRDAVTIFKQWEPKAEVFPHLMDLLNDSDANVQFCTAEVLGQWGHQAEALASLENLMKNTDADVRLFAAKLLEQWGHKAKALPYLLAMLKEDNEEVVLNTADLLRQWGLKDEALPHLLELMESDIPLTREFAASALEFWEPQPKAVPLLLNLLEDQNVEVRSNAMATLACWGPETGILPHLLGLLENSKIEVRLNVVELLKHWPLQTEALPHFRAWMKQANPRLRARAADVLARWGYLPEVLPYLVVWLKDAKLTFYSALVMVLWEYGSEQGVARVFLQAWRSEPWEDLIRFLESDTAQRYALATPEAKQRWATLLQRHENDTEYEKLCHTVIFDWFWNIFNTGQ